MEVLHIMSSNFCDNIADSLGWFLVIPHLYGIEFV